MLRGECETIGIVVAVCKKILKEGLWAIPNDDNIINIPPIEDYMGGKGIIEPDVIGLPEPHGQIGVTGCEVGPHGCAFYLEIEITIKLEVIMGHAEFCGLQNELCLTRVEKGVRRKKTGNGSETYIMWNRSVK